MRPPAAPRPRCVRQGRALDTGPPRHDQLGTACLGRSRHQPGPRNEGTRGGRGSSAPDGGPLALQSHPIPHVPGPLRLLPRHLGCLHTAPSVPPPARSSCGGGMRRALAVTLAQRLACGWCSRQSSRPSAKAVAAELTRGPEAGDSHAASLKTLPKSLGVSMGPMPASETQKLASEKGGLPRHRLGEDIREPGIPRGV